MRSWLMLGILSALSCNAFTSNNPLYCSSDRPCLDSALQCNLTTHVCETPSVLAKDPDITSISPFAVSRAGGFAVRVLGRNFDTLQSISINQINAEYTVTNSTELSLTIPPMPGACGAVPILMTAQDGRMVLKTGKLRYRAEKIDFLLSTSVGPFDPGVHTLQNIKLSGDPVDDLVALNASAPPDFSYLSGLGANQFVGKRFAARMPMHINQLIPTQLSYNGALALLGSNGADKLQLWHSTSPMSGSDIQLEETDVESTPAHAMIGVGNFDNIPNEIGVAFLSNQLNQTMITVASINEKGAVAALWAKNIELRTTDYSNMAVGDFNKDGYGDIVLVSKNAAEVVVLMNDKMRGWVQTNPAQVKTTSSSSIVSDVNSDGYDDIVIYGSSGSVGLAVMVLYNMGGNGFSAYTVPTSISSVRHLSIADFDCDGLPEMVASSGGALDLHINLGDSFSQAQPINLAGRMVRAMTAGSYATTTNPAIFLASPNGAQVDSILLVGRN